MDIPEKDWKIIRSLKDEVLNLACQRILEKSSKIIEANDKTPHARFIELGDLIYDENDLISRMFDDLRRSTAIMQVALWKAHDLIKDKDFSSLSEDFQQRIEKLANSI